MPLPLYVPDPVEDPLPYVLEPLEPLPYVPEPDVPDPLLPEP